MSLEDRVNELEKINIEGFKVPKKFYCKKKNSRSKECCFNHFVGLPVKNGKKHAIYDFELNVLDMVENHRKVWIKKAGGIGATTLFLRWIAWKALTVWKDGNVILLTGPNLDLSTKLIKRIKQLFDNTDFESKNTVIQLGNCIIEAYPSHHLASARSLVDVRCIFADEADFFPPGQQDEALAILDRYDVKSDHPYSILVSTPNLPNQLFWKIEREGLCPHYFKIYLPYKVGLEAGIYTKDEIERAKQSPMFEREMNLVYGYPTGGNIFPYELLSEITEKYDLKLKTGRKILCIDPAFGSSFYGILGAEIIEDIVYIKDAMQIERASPSAMTDFVVKKAKEYDNHVWCDSAHPGIIRDLNERGVGTFAVNFREELGDMTIRAAQAVKEKTVRIHPAFTDLLGQLRTVKFNEKGHPNKKEISFDIGDCFLIAVHKLKTGSYDSLVFDMNWKPVNRTPRDKKKTTGIIFRTEVFE